MLARVAARTTSKTLAQMSAHLASHQSPASDASPEGPNFQVPRTPVFSPSEEIERVSPTSGSAGLGGFAFPSPSQMRTPLSFQSLTSGGRRPPPQGTIVPRMSKTPESEVEEAEEAAIVEYIMKKRTVHSRWRQRLFLWTNRLQRQPWERRVTRRGCRFAL